MADLEIRITGLDKLIKGMDKFPNRIRMNLSKAGNEVAERVLFKTRGILPYPGKTSANMPPTPYYIRGRGTQTASGNRYNSERLGTQYYVKSTGYNTIIGNRASYAKWVIGEQQASFMAPKGWRKLFSVAKEKLRKIEQIYQAWTDRCLKELGL